MVSILQILLMIIGIVKFIIIAHVIMSWLINFNILNIRQPVVGSIWDGLNRLLDPIYGKIRRFLPQMGGLDLAPMIAFIIVIALQIVITNNLRGMSGFY